MEHGCSQYVQMREVCFCLAQQPEVIIVVIVDLEISIVSVQRSESSINVQSQLYTSGAEEAHVYKRMIRHRQRPERPGHG